MSNTAHFKVDTKLASLLGETYRSTELAIKELVDNAWDADAEQVWIYLPEPLSKDPILIIDDGLGMTEKELKTGYLKIASDRRSRKGDRTLRYNRRVKGRKGIGKFAGLFAANEMEISTKARGNHTVLTIHKEVLLSSTKDLEQIGLPLRSEKCSDKESGTAIRLSDLNQNLSFPDPGRLKQILFLEYGRQPNFTIYVNEEALDVEDLPGEIFHETTELKEAGPVELKFTITHKVPPKQSGIAVRVNGKIVGKPQFFGVDEEADISPRLLARVYGEIEADCLEDDVTADWGAIIENSKSWQKVEAYVRFKLIKALKHRQKLEYGMAQARWKLEISREMEKLPPHKRPVAQRAIDKVMRRFYDQKEENIRSMIGVVFELLRDVNVRV